MIKQMRLFLIVTTFVLATLSSTSRIIFQSAKATYVEGLITQDTTWTLVDSPFVLCEDLTINPNVTLTIEPGVRIRFGGVFSLTVLGRLYADGTEKTIEFTSNNQLAEPGDWGAIVFRSVEKSVMTSCYLTYGTEGIVLQGGNVEIKSSGVYLCSQNGINATSSILTIQDSMVMDNDGNGIVISGTGPVTIRRNTIVGNKNGILITGPATSNVNITENMISANKQNGMRLDTISFDNLAITYNNLSSNGAGFYISTPSSTYISNNSISFNNVGFFYEEGEHAASFNDIYGNDLGMDASSNAYVTAEHNYWGDESGPYHRYLNPGGRGDPIEGDGENLDFVFFLSRPFASINARPIAVLLADKNLVPPDESILLFGSTSYDEGRVDRYLFDFGDGNTSGWTTLSTFTYSYSSIGVYDVSLTVMDDFGAVSVNNARISIDVQSLPMLQVDIDLSEYLVGENDQVSVVVQVMDGAAPVDNATVKLFSSRVGHFEHSVGYTDAAGFFTTSFTVPDVTYLTTIRIVATASRSGYADGSDYGDLESLPSLSVSIVAYPDTVKSEETSLVSIYVSSNDQPVDGAAVSLICDGGELSTTLGTTDSDGVLSLGFTAPTMTVFQDINLTATAVKTEFGMGTGKATIRIEPKILVVRITAEPDVTISEAKINLKVHVQYDGPVSEANVTVVSEDYSAKGLTDFSGNATFDFTAPQVNDPSNITISAWASKTKYADGQDQLRLTINPGRLDVQVKVSEPMIDSEGSSIVSVNVTCNGKPVENVSVTVSSTYGSFLISEDTVDSEGLCEFAFNAPRTTVQLNSTIRASAAKNGYVSAVDETTLIISPEIAAAGGGWPITTMLLIIIPVVVVVIVIVLLKMKVISFSVDEEK